MVKGDPGFPNGEEGRVMLERMNGGGHAELAAWGLPYLNIKNDSDVLEIGCGGGANIRRLLEKCPNGRVTGIDYSELSVQMSKETNKAAIEEGRVCVRSGNVLALPFEDGSFDAATAFETIYFWRDIEKAFSEVYRVLKRGGVFFICNETDGEAPEGYEWEKVNDNLKIYRISEVLDFLGKAGFAEIAVERKEANGWICFKALK